MSEERGRAGRMGGERQRDPQGGAGERPRHLDSQPDQPSTITRRGALKVIAATAALGGAAASCAPEEAAESAHEALSGFSPLPPSNPRAAGTLTDPDMLAPVVPWETVLTDDEMRLVATLADVIIPADDRSPAASAVGVPEYINEFVSAPAHKEQLTPAARRAGVAQPRGTGALRSDRLPGVDRGAAARNLRRDLLRARRARRTEAPGPVFRSIPGHGVDRLLDDGRGDARPGVRGERAAAELRWSAAGGAGAAGAGGRGSGVGRVPRLAATLQPGSASVPSISTET